MKMTFKLDDIFVKSFLKAKFDQQSQIKSQGPKISGLKN